MARLPILTATEPTTYIRPSDVGISELREAGSTAVRFANQSRDMYDEMGREIGHSVNDVVEGWQQHQQQVSDQQITQAGNALTQVQLGQIKQYGSTGQYPNADDSINHIRDGLLEQGASDKTMRWFDEQANRLQLHTATVQAAENVKNAGEQANADLQQFAGGQVAAAFHDPSSIDHVLGSIDSTLAAGYSTLPEGHRAEIAQQMKDETVRAAIAGYAQNGDFSNASALLNDPRYAGFIKDPGQTARTIRSYELAGRADQRAARVDARDQQVDADRAAQQQIMGQLQVAPNGAVTYPQNFANGILSNPNMLPASKEAWLRRYQEDTARGSKDTGDPQVFSDFTRRLTLPSDDPQHLTQDDVLAAVRNRQLSIQQSGFLFRQLKQDDPATKALLKQTTNEIAANLNPPGTGGTAAQAAQQSRATSYFWNAYENGLSRGLSPQDLLDKGSKDYIFRDGFDQFRNTGADAVTHPANQVQKTASDAVDIALQVEGLGRNNNPEAVNDILHAGGVNIDVRDNAWCAALVNSALKQAGLPGTGSQLASSFKTWGFPVDAQHVAKGDVFYSGSGTNEGYTGHVGFATGATRQGPHGLEIQVISSHLQGSDSNPGGVEWRDAKSLMIRRAKPPLKTIMSAPADPGILHDVVHWLGSTEPAREPNANE